MTLGERIKELRVLRKMTREQIAERCNISTSTVSRWEGNRATPTRAHRLLLADVLQVDENSLFVTPEVSIWRLDYATMKKCQKIFQMRK